MIIKIKRMKEIGFILTITSILAILFMFVNNLYITSLTGRKIRIIVECFLLAFILGNLVYCIIKAVSILIGNVEL